MGAIDDWIADLQRNRISGADQPIVGLVATCIAAWQQVLAAIAAAGSVTSVGLALPSNEFSVTGSPVTVAGTLTGAWKTQNANRVFAGPTSGGAATPAFRALVAADIPSLSGTYLPLAGGTMTGAIVFQNAGTALAPMVAFNTDFGFYYDASNAAIGITTNGAQAGFWNVNTLSNFCPPGGGTAAFILNTGEGGNFANALVSTGYSTNALPVCVRIRRGRGTQSAPVAVNQNDVLGFVNHDGYGTTGFQTAVSPRGLVIEPTPSDTAMGGSYRVLVTTLGTVTLTEVARLEVATGLSMFGANPVIDANRLLRGRVFTVGTLPTAVDGARANISDATLTMITGLGLAPVGGGTNHVPVSADNVGWKIV